MNIVLWILQGLAAAMFTMAGFMKLSKSRDQLKEMNGMGWVESVSASNVKIIGFLELFAAIGLILPQVTGIVPILTPLAAIGLILTMIGAMTLHMRRGDGAKAWSTNIILLLLSAIIAFGRFGIIPA
jgi:uncharacterized membrane protein YphA (DoxX/SURF4 family)